MGGLGDGAAAHGAFWTGVSLHITGDFAKTGSLLTEALCWQEVSHFQGGAVGNQGWVWAQVAQSERQEKLWKYLLRGTRRVCAMGFPNGKDYMGVDEKLR